MPLESKMAAVSSVDVSLKRPEKLFKVLEWIEQNYTPQKNVLLAVETCTLTNDAIFMAYHIMAT